MECTEAVERRREALRIFKRDPTRDNYVFYRSVISQTRKTLRKAKRTSWRKFCGSLDGLTTTVVIWHMLKRFRNRRLDPANSSSQNGNEDRSAIIQDAIDKLCPPFCPPPIPPPLLPYQGNLAWLDEPFTLDKLQAALHSVKASSNSGLDRIDYRIIKAFPPNLLTSLLDIFNNLFRCSIFPSQWSYSLIHLLSKPNNSGVRPISLTSCLFKIMEKMILNRLYWLIESPLSDFLPNNQFGFQKFRSYQDNLTTLVASIHSGFLTNRDTVAVFVGIKSAFDNVLPHILIQDLQSLNFPLLLLSFIANLISSRNVQFITQGSISAPRTTFKGTPQGSVLSPTLFNLYLRKVNDALHLDTELLQFADDIVIFSSQRNITAAIQSVELSLQGLDLYLRERGLEISLPKTQLIIFSLKRSTARMNYSISLHNHHFLPSNTIRFLGVFLDPKLSGKAHMSSVINKAYAIYTAITIAIDLKLSDATIITNLLSVLESLKHHHNPKNNYLIPLIKSVLEEAGKKGTSIKFIWILSHRGIEENEKADQLAKR
ncbi:PREDICTED: RNA-directed DNA polymerase from mobile element jockey-like [Cyphomyrmex costatus]|uniref:RNA-directed DNA polymerase from mobile element jockey-like n=1 Tax=Cyphomyrmex costatus TaxID=456900 RepID=UPI00085241A2|nr:PREDICTED: RNA-directed DNA polymerase from mobile element jockey-like [Cyphomyrmex costatus]